MEVSKSRSKKSEGSQVDSSSLDPHSSSINLRSSLFNSEKTSQKEAKSIEKESSQSGNRFNYKTPTNKSLNSDSFSPFNKGYSVTSGPKKYRPSVLGSSLNGSLKLGTPV
jgi:hypothetical protein